MFYADDRTVFFLSCVIVLQWCDTYVIVNERMNNLQSKLSHNWVTLTMLFDMCYCDTRELVWQVWKRTITQGTDWLKEVLKMHSLTWHVLYVEHNLKLCLQLLNPVLEVPNTVPLTLCIQHWGVWYLTWHNQNISAIIWAVFHGFVLFFHKESFHFHNSSFLIPTLCLPLDPAPLLSWSLEMGSK